MLPPSEELFSRPSSLVGVQASYRVKFPWSPVNKLVSQVAARSRDILLAMEFLAHRPLAIRSSSSSGEIVEPSNSAHLHCRYHRLIDTGTHPSRQPAGPGRNCLANMRRIDDIAVVQCRSALTAPSYDTWTNFCGYAIPAVKAVKSAPSPLMIPWAECRPNLHAVPQTGSHKIGSCPPARFGLQARRTLEVPGAVTGVMDLPCL